MDRSIHVYGGASETIPCKYGEPLPDLPTSFLLAASTASGKTIVALNLILKYYKDQFLMCFVFSPSINLDPQYKPLKTLCARLAKESRYTKPVIFEDLVEAQLEAIITEQRTIVEGCRRLKQKPPQICIFFDDMADRGDLVNCRKGGKSGGSWLTSLAVSGRHIQITWILATQKLNLIGTTIRLNSRCLLVWRLRNHKEIECLCDELTGFYPKDTIMELYMAATAEPFSFLTIRQDAKTRRDAFWLRFENRLYPEEDKDEHGGRVDLPEQGSQSSAVRQTGAGLHKTHPRG